VKEEHKKNQSKNKMKQIKENTKKKKHRDTEEEKGGSTA
jgi:hypothetical protein